MILSISWQDQLDSLQKKAKQDIAQAEDLDALEKLRVQLLGKKGEITVLAKSIADLPPSDRPLFGQSVNDLKQRVLTYLNDQLAILQAFLLEKKIKQSQLDVTLPGRYDNLGSLHPITQVISDIVSLFKRLGFSLAEGPEIEDEYHNFEALNFPNDHPARAMADTFYFSNRHLLRTHTSPVQIRSMKEYGVPIRLISFGRVYRRDFDQTHTPMFHQLEGLVVEQECTFGHLKGLLQEFLNHFFGKTVRLRFRPSYFPFTEPSAEVDIYQPEQKRWLEILGCGLVHTNVLQGLDIDTDQYAGLAFGVGLDRLAMLRYGIPDLRLLFENDLRFLRQF